MSVNRVAKQQKAEDIKIGTVVNIPKPVMSDITNAAGLDHEPSLKEFADWLLGEDGDVSDVRYPGGTTVFSESDSSYFMGIVLNHPALKEHPIHKEFEWEGDNPLTQETEPGIPAVIAKSKSLWDIIWN